jgi:hypothetical protein
MLATRNSDTENENTMNRVQEKPNLSFEVIY